MPPARKLAVKMAAFPTRLPSSGRAGIHPIEDIPVVLAKTFRLERGRLRTGRFWDGIQESGHSGRHLHRGERIDLRLADSEWSIPL